MPFPHVTIRRHFIAGEAAPTAQQKGDCLEAIAKLLFEAVPGLELVDTKSVKRSRGGHRAAQSAGRKGVFRDYRLRVAPLVRDYGMSERRDQAPADSRAIYDV